MTRLNSDMNPHVFWSPFGALCENTRLKEGWYFWDEAGLLGGGPYHSEQQAINELNKYESALDEEIHR